MPPMFSRIMLDVAVGKICYSTWARFPWAVRIKLDGNLYSILFQNSVR